jgi:uncharacterized protein
MKKIYLVLLLSFTLIILSVGVIYAAEYVRVATAGSGGNYYRLGAGMTSLWNELFGNVDEIDTEKYFAKDIMSTIQATQGSPHNCDLLADEDVEISFLGSEVGYDAYYNLGRFEDRPVDRYKKLRFIGFMYPNPFWLVAMNWADDIEGIRDLKGKRVSVGMVGSHGEYTWQSIMDFLGWTYNDVQAEYTVHGTAIDQVRNRQIDALIWPDAPTSPSYTEIFQTGFARALSYDQDIIEHLTKDTLSFPYTIPANTIAGQTDAFDTFASAAILVTHENVDKEIIYNTLKAMHENKDYLIDIYKLASFISIEDAPFGQPFPLHEGAEQFYKEVGILDKFIPQKAPQ